MRTAIKGRGVGAPRVGSRLRCAQRQAGVGAAARGRVAHAPRLLHLPVAPPRATAGPSPRRHLSRRIPWRRRLARSFPALPANQDDTQVVHPHPSATLPSCAFIRPRPWDVYICSWIGVYISCSLCFRSCILPARRCPWAVPSLQVLLTERNRSAHHVFASLPQPTPTLVRLVLSNFLHPAFSFNIGAEGMPSYSPMCFDRTLLVCMGTHRIPNAKTSIIPKQVFFLPLQLKAVADRLSEPQQQFQVSHLILKGTLLRSCSLLLLFGNHVTLCMHDQRNFSLLSMQSVTI